MRYSTEHVVMFVFNNLDIVGRKGGKEIILTANRLARGRRFLPQDAINKIFPDPELRKRFTAEIGTATIMKGMTGKDFYSI